MNVLCKVGLHRYTIVHEGSYNVYGDADPIPRTRGCTRCFKEQILTKHLLGFHPVSYKESWVTTHKEVQGCVK
jgi:hypothetical protein